MVKSPIFRFSRFGETANRKVISQADFQIFPVRRDRESEGDFPVIIGMFAATASARSKEKDFAGI